MQAIAVENNLSETAFTVPSERADADFDLRWFTPAAEVELCGHATLAAGHVLTAGPQVRFSTRSGILTVRRRDEMLELDLPAAQLTETREPALMAALGLSDAPVWLAQGCNDAALIALPDEAAVRAVAPDFAALGKIRRMAVVTAPGDREAIASRVFVPYCGIDEDPVTGSAHAALVPYWAERRIVDGPRRALAVEAMRIADCNWLGEDQAEISVKVRSLAPPVAALRDGDWLRFDRPEYGVAPGQAAVVYDGTRLIGGGWIAETVAARESEMDAAAA
jgi:PhzF family phenazine biosynthesis protein